MQQSIRNHFRRPRGGHASAVSCPYFYRINKSAQWVSTREKPENIASLSKAKSIKVVLSIMLLYFCKTLFGQHATKAGWKETTHHAVTFSGRDTPWFVICITAHKDSNGIDRQRQHRLIYSFRNYNAKVDKKSYRDREPRNVKAFDDFDLSTSVIKKGKWKVVKQVCTNR